MMNTEKIIRESKVILSVTLTTGLILLAAGIIFTVFDVRLIENNRALIGLSFIPLSAALVYYLKLTQIQKSPQKMKGIIVSENDERLIAVKNEANAKAFRITQAVLFLAYMGYTLMVPEDIFEAVGWWLLLILLFVSFVSQGVLLSMAMRRENAEDRDD